MAVPPSVVVYKDAYAVGSGTTRVLTQRTVAAGDVVAVVGQTEDFSTYNVSSLAATAGTATIGTITKQRDAGTASHCANVLFTFRVVTGGTLTLTATFSATTSTRHSTFWTYVATGSGGVGNTALTTTSATTITASLATSANSCVIALAADWAATGGATTTLTPAGGVLDAHEVDGVNDNVANGNFFSSRGGHWADTGSAGTVSYGVSVPTSAAYNLVAVEFLAAAAFTVTAAHSSVNFTLGLKVQVVTGAIEAGGASAGTGVSPPNASLTPAFTNSLIVEGLCNESNSTAFTASASNTLTNTATDGSTESTYGNYTGTVTAATPVTVGASAPTGQNTALAAYELRPLAGVTPVIDGSSPAFVHGSASPQTTASFTPPAGSVLVAIVLGTPSSSVAPTISDTSGLGLTWTQRAFFWNSGAASVAIYTATVPGVFFDAVGPAGGAGTAFTTSPGTWTHVNNGNGILVGCTVFTGSTDTITAVTYGGVALTKIGFTQTGSAAGGISFWGLIGPTCPTGSNTVSVTASDTNNHNAGSISVIGAGSLGALFTATNSGAATSQAITVNGTTTGGLIVTVAAHGAIGTWGLTGGTVQWSHNNTVNSAADNGAGGTAPSTGGGANQTLTWTNTASDQFAVLAVEVLPVAAGGGPVASPVAIPHGGRYWRENRKWRRRLTPVIDAGAAVAPTPVTLTDAAAGISEDGALAVLATVPLPDAGGAAEALSAAVTEAGSDTAGAVEGLAVAVSVPLAEVAGAAESQAIGVKSTDVAGAVDTLAVTVAATLADAGAAADAPVITAVVPLAEAAGAADSPVIAATVPLADPGAAADIITGAVVLGLADVAAAAESQVSGQPVTLADTAGATEAAAVAAAVPLPDAGAAAEALAVTVTLTLADKGAAAESQVSGQPVTLADVAGAADVIAASVAAALPEVAAAADAIGLAVATGLADAAGAADAISVVQGAAPAEGDVAAARESLSVVVSVPLADLAGVADQIGLSAAVGFLEAAAAADAVVIITGIHPSGTVTWIARPEEPRWEAEPDEPRWEADPGGARWHSSPELARWSTQPELARWRIMMAAFDPISSDSLEEVNVRWTSDLDGTVLDPTVSPLTVQMAFPVSSGNPLQPAHAVTWLSASWLAGGTGKGYVAQCLVGPGGGVVTLAAGKYDVWSWVQGSPESPKKFAGTLTVY